MANELNNKLKAFSDEVNVQWVEVESGMKATEKKIKEKLVELLAETGDTIRLKKPFHTIINGNETDVIGLIKDYKGNVIIIYSNTEKEVNYLPDFGAIPLPVQVTLFNLAIEVASTLPTVYVVVEALYNSEKDEFKVDTIGTYKTYAEALKPFNDRLAWSKSEDGYKSLWESHHKATITDKEDNQLITDVETRQYYSLAIKEQFVK